MLSVIRKPVCIIKGINYAVQQHTELIYKTIPNVQLHIHNSIKNAHKIHFDFIVNNHMRADSRNVNVNVKNVDRFLHLSKNLSKMSGNRRLFPVHGMNTEYELYLQMSMLKNMHNTHKSIENKINHFGMRLLRKYVDITTKKPIEGTTGFYPRLIIVKGNGTNLYSRLIVAKNNISIGNKTINGSTVNDVPVMPFTLITGKNDVSIKNDTGNIIRNNTRNSIENKIVNNIPINHIRVMPRTLGVNDNIYGDINVAGNTYLYPRLVVKNETSTINSDINTLNGSDIQNFNFSPFTSGTNEKRETFQTNISVKENNTINNTRSNIRNDIHMDEVVERIYKGFEEKIRFERLKKGY